MFVINNEDYGINAPFTLHAALNGLGHLNVLTWRIRKRLPSRRRHLLCAFEVAMGGRQEVEDGCIEHGFPENQNVSLASPEEEGTMKYLLNNHHRVLRHLKWVLKLIKLLASCLELFEFHVHNICF